ncbi:T9SS type B sorting domain-containing protein [Aurantibacter sp.]|uniref:T9SS type B sorting domain-containing protein n=1 Tax=Aurantibacter sp. TaxID=2807103 RepID=UPI0032657B2A
MKRNMLNIIVLLAGFFAYTQDCTKVNFPVDGATNIAVDATITWPEVNGINGYLISLGTSVNGTDILSREATGINNFYTAPVGLPENTLIYVTISVLLFNATPTDCESSSFRTMDVTTAPSCTKLLAPDDNAANVTVVTDIIWQYSSGATSYNVTIGTSSGGNELLYKYNVGNVLSYNPPIDFPQDVRIYVSIIPENENGSSATCTEESFFTGHVDDPCEALDLVTGEVKYLAPDINFPTLFIKCNNSGPLPVIAEGQADGFRWIQIIEGDEVLLSENRNFQLSQTGNFMLEAYNLIDRSGIQIECASTKNFNVIPSELPIIESIDIRPLYLGKQITINTLGLGNYEYAMDNKNGPYQDDSVFFNVTEGSHMIFVRDKNGCGLVSKLIERGLKLEDFPNFFTPNGDGINDLWQLIHPPEIKEIREIVKGNISIFDRYGNLLIEVDPSSKGWDGNFNGNPVPSADYWFKAISFNQKVINGHFTLKR